jgi:hypothetical protein
VRRTGEDESVTEARSPHLSSFLSTPMICFYCRFYTLKKGTRLPHVHGIVRVDLWTERKITNGVMDGEDLRLGLYLHFFSYDASQLNRSLTSQSNLSDFCAVLWRWGLGFFAALLVCEVTCHPVLAVQAMPLARSPVSLGEDMLILHRCYYSG